MKEGSSTILKKKIDILRSIVIAKRQRFILVVLFLTLGLFFTEHNFGKSGFYITLLLSLLTSLLFFISDFRDIKENFTPYIFILPFLYTLSFGLFYFLTPARFLSRIVLTSLYGIGLYSLFLSHNIFTVGSIRTIALLSSAKTVSFIITLISYFFLTTVMFSLRWHAYSITPLVFAYSFLLVLHSLWSVTLDESLIKHVFWAFILAGVLSEISIVLWFWPTTPTVIALFLTGIFYTIVGLSHVWLDRRLFKSVIWEYLWISVIVFCILILFTSWKA